MSSHVPKRETKSSDWIVINEYFDQLFQSFERNEISQETFRNRITDKIGYANNYGVDRLLTTIENEGLEGEGQKNG